MSARRRRWLRWVFVVIFGATGTGFTAEDLSAAAVPFSAEQGLAGATGPTGLAFADIDGDGDLDLFGASDYEVIAWYPNDGDGTFGSEQLIRTLVRPQEIAAADIDGDGDVDLLVVGEADYSFFWLENTDGEGTFGSEQTIGTALSPYAIAAADLDGDGDLDVVGASKFDDLIGWYENTDGAGTFGSAQNIAGTDFETPMSVTPADIDGDGDIDLFATSIFETEVAWFENTDGEGSFSSAIGISSTVSGQLVVAADIDRDGDLDAVVANNFGDSLQWYENLGSGAFTLAQTLSTLSRGGTGVFWPPVFAADLDGDGDTDLLSSFFDAATVAWYENTDGEGTFGPGQLLATAADGPLATAAADVDGDGDIDAVVANYYGSGFVWHENETIHRGAAFPEAVVISTSSSEPKNVLAADIDGDGDADVVVSSNTDDEVVWHENTDGAGTFGTAQTLGTDADNPLDGTAADVDGDGDLDLVSPNRSDNEVVWYENDGSGSFGTAQLVGAISAPRVARIADLDGDGDLDVLAGGQTVAAWFENTDGGGTFSSAQELATDLERVYSVQAADLDGDGDLDALYASQLDHLVAWQENDGTGSFGTRQTITTHLENVFDVAPTDLDRDGDLDIVSGSGSDDAGTISWFENLDGQGSFGSEQEVATEVELWRVEAADLDFDGDPDIVALEQSNGRVLWFENLDGAGKMGTAQLISSDLTNGQGLALGDLDGDGDLDLLTTDNGSLEISWFENRGGQVRTETEDRAQGYLAVGQEDDFLAITVTHAGRAGDSPIEISSLAFRFRDIAGIDLTELTAESLLESLSIYLDDGSGSFDEADALVATVTDFAAITTNGSGVLDVPVADGDANFLVEFGAPRTFFVALTVAGLPTTPSVKVQHRTLDAVTLPLPVTTAEDASADIPVTVEHADNVESSGAQFFLADSTCQSSSELRLEGVTIVTTLVCEAGTELQAEVAVESPGDLTLRAGQVVHLSDGFSISGDHLSVEIDPALEPE